MSYLADSMREAWLDPINDEEEPRYRCACCDKGMDDFFAEWGDWCSQKCWYEDNRGIMKRWIVGAIESGCPSFEEVEQRLAKHHDLNMYGFMTIPTYERFKRAIQNRINEKAANSAATLKAA